MMKYKNVILVIFFAVLVAFAAFGFAQDQKPSNEELFVRGNNFYQEGEYSKAIGEYEKIINNGQESAFLRFNIADAYFKSGNLGRALLNYERARYLDPRNPDILSNYKYARSMIKGRVVSAKGLWAWRPLFLYSGNFTINELTLAASGLFILFLILVFLYAVRTALTFSRAVFMIFVFIFMIFNSLIVWNKFQYREKHAVVVVESEDALFGPFDTATKFFPINEGMGVTILKDKGDWCKIRRNDGKIGWVKRDTLERLASK